MYPHSEFRPTIFGNVNTEFSLLHSAKQSRVILSTVCQLYVHILGLTTIQPELRRKDFKSKILQPAAAISFIPCSETSSK